MGSGKGGLIALGILIVICIIFPISAYVIVPFIIISLLIGFAIKPFQPKDHGPDIRYAAHTIADAINADIVKTPQEVARERPSLTGVTWDDQPLNDEEEPEEIEPRKASDYFNNEKRSVMLND